MAKIKRIPVILDGDPGHDDAITWIMAAADPRLEILGITTCGGNQLAWKTAYNAQRIAALVGLDVEVAKGSENPLMVKLNFDPKYHGESGLDGTVLPEPKRPLSKLSSPELMSKLLMEATEPVVIIATGPQTNVAAVLLAHPELKAKIRCISIMGGGIRNGNVTPAAEFNIIVDPEACQIEFMSGVPVIMCGLDVTEKALVYPSEWEVIRKMGNPVAKVVAELFDFFFIHLKELGHEAVTLHDPCAYLAISDPEMFTMADYYIEVETRGEYCRGATVADLNNTLHKKPNVTAVMDLDRSCFIKKLYEACESYQNWEVK